MKTTVSLKPAGTALNFRFIYTLSTAFFAKHYAKIAGVCAVVAYVAFLYDRDELMTTAALLAVAALCPEFKEEKGGEK